MEELRALSKSKLLLMIPLASSVANPTSSIECQRKKRSQIHSPQYTYVQIYLLLMHNYYSFYKLKGRTLNELYC